MLTTKQHLEHYFAAYKDLESRRGTMDNVTYTVFRQGLIRRLRDRSFKAVMALSRADEVLQGTRLLTNEQTRQREKLLNYDIDALKAWGKEHKRRNIERLTYAFADALDAVDIQPFPEPSPEAVERTEAARNHRIGYRDGEKGPGAPAPADMAGTPVPPPPPSNYRSPPPNDYVPYPRTMSRKDQREWLDHEKQSREQARGQSALGIIEEAHQSRQLQQEAMNRPSPRYPTGNTVVTNGRGRSRTADLVAENQGK
jgi:hypothetical protein